VGRFTTSTPRGHGHDPGRKPAIPSRFGSAADGEGDIHRHPGRSVTPVPSKARRVPVQLGLKSGKFLRHNSLVTIPAGTLVPRDARDFGAYQLIAKLATGGMAEIFLARGSPSSSSTSSPDVNAALAASEANDKSVLVLKRILPHLAEDDHFVTMFRDEADLASKLLHKNVCRVDAFGEYAGTWFIAMEYLHGVPLSRMMTRLSKAGKMLDFRVVAGIICQACEGLHAAHEAKGPDGVPLQIVHRDVSPPNIMVCSDGTVKLLDFGIAKARGANSRTRTGTVKGKNAYMSPEQILGKPLDRRSDIFALAVVMYEMLAIKRLFHRDSDFLTFKAITEEAIPDILERRPDLPPGMRAALVQAMARDPNGRFDTMQAFGNAIRQSVATSGGPATPDDLARLLANDFGDEMSARDEILRAAEEVKSAPAIKLPPTPPPMPPPRLHRPTPPPPLPGVSGEMPTIARKDDSGSIGSVPSMIVASSGSSPNTIPPVNAPNAPVGATVNASAPAAARTASPGVGVLDLTSSVQPDSWMVDPDTDLLRGHRVKSLVRTLIGLAVLAVLIGVAIFVISLSNTDPADDAKHTHQTAVAPPPSDASLPGKPTRAAFDELDSKIAKGDPWEASLVMATAKLGPPQASRTDDYAWWSVGDSGHCYVFGLVKQPNESTCSVVAPTSTISLRECALIASGQAPSDEVANSDVVALSKFGFFSISATAKTTIYVDNNRVGDTPLTKLPLAPGPHMVKAVGPRGKTKTMKVTIYGGRSTDEGSINWN